MHLIVCVDDRDGICFCGRRLSRDSAQITHMLHLTEGRNLWVHPYSAKLFPSDRILIDETYLEKAGAGDYCFVETGPLPDQNENLESVILYRWNRAYPATTHFPGKLLENMCLEHSEEFPGSSHEKITMERFVP